MERRVKVLYLVERVARAGTELAMLRQLQRLDRDRFEPALCCLCAEATDRSLLPGDLPCHLLDAPWNLVHPRSLGLYRRLVALLRSQRPDILHSFLFISNVLGPHAARGAGVGATVATRGRMGIEWQATRLHRLLQRRANRRTDLILCKSRAIADEILRVEKPAADKIEILPNGVDLTHYEGFAEGRRRLRLALAERHGIPAEGPLLAALGNLKPIKGQDLLIEGLAAMPPARRPLLALAGRGESEAALRERVAALGLAERVFFLGHLEDPRPLLAGADLFVSASRSEGQPNALLEAAALGLPLALSDIPGHRETAGSHALFFPLQPPVALADTLDRALCEPDRLGALARAARLRVAQAYDLSHIQARLEGLYLRLAGLAES